MKVGPSKPDGSPLFSLAAAREFLRTWWRVEEEDGSTVAYVPDKVTAERIVEALEGEPMTEEKATERARECGHDMGPPLDVPGIRGKERRCRRCSEKYWLDPDGLVYGEALRVECGR